ncbi:MAG: 16S rRNA (cytidine(1402)-2'-O)-methyltransferase [Acidimicrobiales bacterium]
MATPLGNMSDLSPRASATLASADVVACEDTRRTGKLLNLAGVSARRLVAVHEHNEASMIPSILDHLASGATVVLVSDAGMPVISDPGERLVNAALDAGFDVSVVPGPSAAVAALAVSGLAADRWVFEGFLARKGRERSSRLAAVAAETRTVILYEAPHRLVATLTDLVGACGGDRQIALARELTKLHEELWRGSLTAALAFSLERAPRGEYVLVLAGAAPPAEVSDATIIEALTRDGATVAAVAASLQVPKNRVYELDVRARKSV